MASLKKSLTHNGYSIYKSGCNEDIIKEIKNELTVTPKVFDSMIPTKSYSLYRENENKIYMPRFYGLNKFGMPERDLLHLDNLDDCSRLIFVGELRDSQREPVDAFMKAAFDPLRRGGIISIPCAGGKTVIALYLACQIKKKTLFVIHKDFLGNQFKERAAQFVPTARIGIIKQKKVDVDNKDMVVASLQSLAMRDYDDAIFKQFGLVIIDECHHTSAEVFSRALLKISAPIMLGLSATLNRKDGLRKVFEWYLGKPVLKVKKKPLDTDLTIKQIQYYSHDEEYNEIKKLWNGKINAVAMLNNICNYQPRNEMIFDNIKQIFQEEPERQMIILSERKNQLSSLEQLFNDNNIYDYGYYVGGMSRDALKSSETKKIILATYQMASEGMDIPTLNTLFMASPISDIEQSIGRIQRQRPEDRKYTPLVIDIVDRLPMFVKRANVRVRFYQSKNYNILENEKQETEPDDKEYEFLD